MTEQNNEETTSQKSEETSDSTTEETTESTENEDVDVLKKKMAEIEEKNRQLYERTKKAELKAKEVEATKLSKEVSQKKEEKEDTFNPLDSVKLLNALKDYSQDEIDLISRQAKAYDISLEEAAQHDDVKLFIEAKREKLKTDNASPTPSTRQAPVNKDFSQWKTEDIKPLTENPTPENRKKLSEYVAWARAQK